MQLTLTMPANVANARGSWHVGHRAKKRFYRESDERQLVGLVPRPPADPLTSAHVRVRFHVHNLLDPDNLYARMKHVLDWLVTRGYLADDDVDTVSLEVSQEIERKDKRVEITVEAL
jgi:hypothetical protein